MLRSGSSEGNSIIFMIEAQVDYILSCLKVLKENGADYMDVTPQAQARFNEKVQKGFRPLVPGFAAGELNNLQSFADLVDDQTCAIMLETVQGEGGVTDGAGIRAGGVDRADCRVRFAGAVSA